jgi:hypothetical protein
MQRLEAKSPPERPLFTAETRNAQNRQQDPRRNGLFSIDDGFYGSGRLNGGGSSLAKRVSKSITGNFLKIRPQNRLLTVRERSGFWNSPVMIET